MKSQEKIIVEIIALRSEIKALRNNYKNNNKLLASFHKNIPQKWRIRRWNTILLYL